MGVRPYDPSTRAPRVRGDEPLCNVPPRMVKARAPRVRGGEPVNDVALVNGTVGCPRTVT